MSCRFSDKTSGDQQCDWECPWFSRCQLFRVGNLDILQCRLLEVTPVTWLCINSSRNDTKGEKHFCKVFKKEGLSQWDIWLVHTLFDDVTTAVYMTYNWKLCFA